MYRFLFLLCGLLAAPLAAQHIAPVWRLHAQDSPYSPYADNFLSGFMLSPQRGGMDGVLQMPFVGDPVLVYIGEKDSTQYTSYASGYRTLVPPGRNDSCEISLLRYGITARAASEGRHAVQRYSYPDTTAAKGVLIDLDHITGREADTDLRVEFVGQNAMRAWRRDPSPEGAGQPVYYYARFSRPFASFNVRRERVTLASGRKARRCKVAFTFDLRPGEALTLKSAVSPLSSDAAYACVEGHQPSRSFSDAYEAVKARDEKPALAAADGKASPRDGKRPTKIKAATRRDDKQPWNFIEAETRDAALQAGFYAALGELAKLPALRNVRTATEWMEALATLYPSSEKNLQADTPARLDSLLRDRARAYMAGNAAGRDTDGSQAVWFVLNAIGLQPAGNSPASDGWQLRRPLFNVVTFRLPENRRFILHAKANLPERVRIGQATVQGEPWPADTPLPHSLFIRGGVVAVRMARP